MTKPIEPGCLALVVGAPGCDCDHCALNRGKLVRVLRRLGPGDSVVHGPFVFDVSTGVWEVRTLGSPLIMPTPFFDFPVAQRAFVPEQLKRIDDIEGKDETLTWKAVPKERTPA